QERNLLELVFNSVREGILLIDRMGVIRYANHATMQLIGLREEEVGSAILWKLIPGLSQTLPLYQDVDRMSHQAVVTREIELTYPETRYVRLYMTPLYQEVVKDTNFMVIFTDLTEERKLTEEQIENEKISSIFMLAAGVAHEIGNPLNSISIHLNLVHRQVEKLKDSAAKEKMQHSLQICTHEIQRLDDIIKNFLEAIRPHPLNLQETELFPLIEDVIKTLHNELENLGVEIEIEVKSTPSQILVDCIQLKQVFFNILKNAMDSMDRGGLIKISLDTNDEFAIMSFADQGSGISQDDITKIFDPFYTTKKTGHGMGMMIIQRIIRAHGGQISIDSKTNFGTIVTLQLPLNCRRIRMLHDSE
ncbi:MAG: hypothetical protein A2007_00295, partial [Verrucomicrobia bacterium GWC2_42_7]